MLGDLRAAEGEEVNFFFDWSFCSVSAFVASGGTCGWLFEDFVRSKFYSV